MKKLLMAMALLPMIASSEVQFDYEENGDGTIIVVGPIGNPSGELAIPAQIDGRQVVAIGKKAFKKCINITEVVLPEGLVEIRREAFIECTGVRRIYWPSSLRKIEWEAFAGCKSLVTVDLTGTALESIGEEAFCNCPSLIEVALPSTLMEMGAYLFGACDKLRTVRFEGMIPTVIRKPDYGSTVFDCSIYAAADRKVVDYHNEHGGPDWNYTGILSGVTTYVNHDNGWNEIVATGTWQGCPIQYIGPSVTPAIESSYGPFVPGEKVSLTIPALIGYTAKKLPSGLKLNKKTGEITGAAKKPTGEAGVTVTFTKKNAPTQTAQFVVGPIPTINVTLEGDTEKCKVTGANKAYLVGKKVSLMAKGPKGTAFVGWFRDGEPWPSEEEFLEPKIKYVMTAESLNLVAQFKAEEVSVACDTSAGCVVKEKVSFPVIVDCESGIKSVSAKKLPSGLKYNKKTGCIEGAAKKAGSYPFSLTVTTKAGSKVTQSFALTVREAETPLR